MMAEPIRALELHYPMIQFLLIIIIAMLFLDAFCLNTHAHRLNQQTDEMHAP